MIRRLDILVQIRELEKISSMTAMQKKIEDVCLYFRSDKQMNSCAVGSGVQSAPAPLPPPLPLIGSSQKTTATASQVDISSQKVLPPALIAPSATQTILSATTAARNERSSQKLSSQLFISPAAALQSTAPQSLSSAYKSESNFGAAKPESFAAIPSTNSFSSSAALKSTHEITTSAERSTASSASDSNPSECFADRNLKTESSTSIPLSAASSISSSASNPSPVGFNPPKVQHVENASSTPNLNPLPIQSLQVIHKPQEILCSTAIAPSTDSVTSKPVPPAPTPSDRNPLKIKFPSERTSNSHADSERIQSATIQSDSNSSKAEHLTPIPLSSGPSANTSKPIHSSATQSDHKSSNNERIVATDHLSIASSHSSQSDSRGVLPLSAVAVSQTHKAQALGSRESALPPPPASMEGRQLRDEDVGGIVGTANQKFEPTFDFTGNPTFNFFTGNTSTLPQLDTTYFSHSVQLPNALSLLAKPLVELPDAPVIPPSTLAARADESVITPPFFSPPRVREGNADPVRPAVAPQAQAQIEPPRTASSKSLEPATASQNQFAAPFPKAPLTQASFFPSVPNAEKPELEPKTNQPIGRGLLCPEFEDDDDDDDGDDTTRNFSCV